MFFGHLSAYIGTVNWINRDKAVILIKSFVSKFFTAAAVAAAVFSAPAVAAEKAETPWVETPQTAVRLISATEGVGEHAAVQLGLHFKLKDNWKIYWRNPGDAGFPPRLNWEGSENLDTTDFRWPVPSRFKVLGFQSLGYKKEVVFPIKATVKNAKDPLKLTAKLDYLACDDVCIPYKANLALTLPAGSDAATDNFQLISKYDNQVPGDGAAHGITIEKVETAGAFKTIDKDVREGAIRVVAASAVPFSSPDVFVEGPELTFFSQPQVDLQDGGKKALITIPASEEEKAKILQASLTLTLKDGERSAEKTLIVQSGPAAAPASSDLPLSLPVILGLALIGGLILNLMPCVLPVLSLKVLGFISHGGGENRTIRLSFLETSLGIVVTFLAIASALAGLKAAGSAVGWGIQFQHPWFIVGLTIIVSLFAYNLWGLFEVALPGWLSNFAGGAHSDSEERKFGGNFATGVFATILATPCSAPFLGTAVGFALAGSIIDIYLVFAALGVGMALPFILIAAFPALAAKLPKPGNWMIRLKQILGVALAATAIWLLSVLAVQLSLDAALLVGALMAGMGVILFAKPRLAPSWHKAAGAGLVVLALGAFWTPYAFTPSAELSSAKSNHWVKFDPAAIPKLVAEGNTVFVDITAEWCITCQVNKAAVLNRGDIFDVLAGGGKVIAMKGDWTRPDPIITAYLKSNGRFGIPFNAIYGPGAADGVVLPELLTTGNVEAGMNKASGGTLFAKN